MGGSTAVASAVGSRETAGFKEASPHSGGPVAPGPRPAVMGKHKVLFRSVFLFRYLHMIIFVCLLPRVSLSVTHLSGGGGNDPVLGFLSCILVT